MTYFAIPICWFDTLDAGVGRRGEAPGLVKSPRRPRRRFRAEHGNIRERFLRISKQSRNSRRAEYLRTAPDLRPSLLSPGLRLEGTHMLRKHLLFSALVSLACLLVAADFAHAQRGRGLGGR